MKAVKWTTVRWIVFMVLFMVAVALAGYFLGKRSGRVDGAEEEIAAPIQVATPKYREVTLYLEAADAPTLVPEPVRIEECDVEIDCVRSTVVALVRGGSGKLLPIFPANVEVLGVEVSDGVASVDFSRNLLAGHPGGSRSELLTVFGLADTLAVNFPHIRQVRFLVDGQMVETLKGHVDLTGPVSADFKYARAAKGKSPSAEQRALLESVDGGEGE